MLFFGVCSYSVSQDGPESLENECLCEMIPGTDSSSVSFGPLPSQFQCAQVSGDIMEIWIVRFDLGIPPGSFVAVGGWVQERTQLCLACFGCCCAPWSVQAVTFPQSCWMRKCCVIVHRFSCSSGQAVAAKVLSSPFLSAAMMMRRCSSVRKKFPSKMIPEMRPTSPT